MHKNQNSLAARSNLPCKLDEPITESKQVTTTNFHICVVPRRFHFRLTSNSNSKEIENHDRIGLVSDIEKEVVTLT